MMVCALNYDCRIPLTRNSLMIVDDEPNVLQAFRLMVGQAFPEVDISTAKNGREALSVFRINHPAVILMDLNMPGMDGQAAFDQLGTLCRAEDWEMPSVVFCTGFAIPNSVQSIVKQNSRHKLLIKPVTGRMMMEALQTKLA